jgi:charged multivesicular body protein 7
MKPSPSPVRALEPYAAITHSRLQALYADISRQKHSNPTAYHANVHWWQPVLQEYVSSGAGSSSSRLVLSAGRQLMEDLRVEGVGKPLGIGAVIVSIHPANPTRLGQADRAGFFRTS